MSKKVYLGSSFSLKDRVQRVYDKLTEAGHEVPDVWWDESREQANLKGIDLPDEEWYEHETVVQRANRHYSWIEKCDAFVIVCPPFGETKKFNGAAVELGYAHAHRLDIYAIGDLERSAMYEPVTFVDTTDQLLALLEGEK